MEAKDYLEYISEKTYIMKNNQPFFVTIRPV